MKFDYLGQDTTPALFFYYNLAADSPQTLCCDIYTGRIKPLEDGTDRYQQIRDYLNKAVAAHQENNILDQFVSYNERALIPIPDSLADGTDDPCGTTAGSSTGKNNARFMRYSMGLPKRRSYRCFTTEDLIC
ncbi:MAG: hypothetical protein ACLU30_13810 [Odoribacter splanchnicus]